MGMISGLPVVSLAMGSSGDVADKVLFSDVVLSMVDFGVSTVHKETEMMLNF